MVKYTFFPNISCLILLSYPCNQNSKSLVKFYIYIFHPIMGWDITVIIYYLYNNTRRASSFLVLGLNGYLPPSSGDNWHCMNRRLTLH